MERKSLAQRVMEILVEIFIHKLANLKKFEQVFNNQIA